MKDKIVSSYRSSKNIYDDVMTQGSFLSRLYNRVFWGAVVWFFCEGKKVTGC